MRRFILCMLILLVAGYSAEAASEHEPQQTTTAQQNQDGAPEQPTPPAQPQTVVPPNGLAGISKINIKVDLQGAGDTGLTAEGLATTLTAAVLRSKTVTVVTEKDSNTPARLYLDVYAGPWDKKSYLYYFELSLQRAVLVPQAEGPWLSIHYAATWFAPWSIGTCSGGDVSAEMKQYISNNVDKFTVDYFKGNPQSSAHHEQETVNRGWLGIGVDELTANTRDFYGVDHGVVVSNIDEDSAAAKSDLQVEDVITAVNSQRINSSKDLQETITGLLPGTIVALTVIRNRVEKTVSVTLGAMPAEYADSVKPPAAKEEHPVPTSTSSALGLTIRRATTQDKEHFGDAKLAGVVVTNVDANGPAQKWLAEGDLISKVNQTAIKSLADWDNALEQAHQSGKSYVVLRVTRKVAGKVTHSIIDINVEW